ncbi:tyrosinase [Thalassospira marina]|uniref:Tyrosinase n=2 Tax=Thalassospira marina TaxID=2048283 RepID=A0A2N3KJ84_9PROT|nr:tyrosinase [Thalassospira marina]
MVYVRKSVWANGGGFSDPILFWYAKGVEALQKKPMSDKTGWRFMAAVHGIDKALWQQYGYYTPGEAMPPQSEQDLFWNQCQHQTWYFIPWHRGYVWSIEGLVREEIIKQGGPADWAMPYWNYSDSQNPQARMLPPAFASKTLPDNSPNPLYVAQRYGLGTVPIVLPAKDVTLEALLQPRFTGTGAGALSGFGGLKTGFSHSGQVSGRLENHPHNIVHVDVGGEAANGDPGLMSDPDTAGLDPIFWLHHANIDRLWSVWTRNPNHQNPTDPAWLNGPMDRKFVVPTVDGTNYFYTPAEMLDSTAAPLNYIYDEEQSSADTVMMVAAKAAPQAGVEGKAMADGKKAELVGANASTIKLVGAGAKTSVKLDQALGNQMAQGFKAMRGFATSTTPPADGAPKPADQVLLNLENIRADKDAAVVDVYVNLPAGENPEDRLDLLAGTIGFFGVRKASLPDQPHGGMGISEVFDITRIVECLEASGALSTDNLNIDLIPRKAVSEDAGITVERISIYRQEQ